MGFESGIYHLYMALDLARGCFRLVRYAIGVICNQLKTTSLRLIPHVRQQFKATYIVIFTSQRAIFSLAQRKSTFPSDFLLRMITSKSNNLLILNMI
jgi:hypothetical protein